jgi:AAHS family 4-hydroxybenzoate transporter-like MFS transporter
MNVREMIDKAPVTSLQIAVVAVCFVLNMLDGIDVLAVSFAAPPIMNEWGLSSSAMGGVFSAGLIGMTLGAMFLASFSDIIGRRKMLLICVLMVAVGTAMTALVTSSIQLVVLRVVTGLGIGAMLATLTSMVSEYMPARRRNLSISIMVGGYPLGAILGGFLAAWVIPEYGWRAMFAAFGAITAMMFPIVLALPESLHFLVQKRPVRTLEKLNKVLVKMKQAPLESLPAAEELHLDLEKGSKQRFSILLFAKTFLMTFMTLFTRERRTSTLLLWTAFFMTFMTLYFIYSWIPKIIVDSGLSLEKGIYTSIALNVGAIIGVVSLGYLADRLGLALLTLIYLLGAATAMVVFAISPPVITILLAVTFFVGLFIQGGFSGLYSASARIYPTEVRTTGVGWAIGAGRTGAIIGPFVGGVLMDMKFSITAYFILFAIPLILAAFTAFTIKKPEF